MPNVKQIISNHNKTILTKESSTENTTNNCNCRVKEKCPVDKKCQTSSLIYQATLTQSDNNKDETYIGLNDNTLKTRYNGHTNSFRHDKYRNPTALSNYIYLDVERQKNKLLIKVGNNGQRKSIQTFRKYL